MSGLHIWLGKMRNRWHKPIPAAHKISIEQLTAKEKVSFPHLQDKILLDDIDDLTFVPKAAYLHQKEYQSGDASIYFFDNVLYCPKYNLLLDANRNVITESVNTDVSSDINYGFIQQASVERVHQTAVIFRSVHNNYYHTLIDNIPRLFVFKTWLADNKLDFTLAFSGALKGYEKFFAEKILGDAFPACMLNEEKLYQFQTLVFPAFLTRRFSGYLPMAYRQHALPQFLPQRPRKKDKLIFISRKKQLLGQNRFMLNERQVVHALTDLGFKAYRLEDLDMQAQIALFYDARMVVAAHGAGLTNLILAEKAAVIELFPSKQIVPHYYFLCKSMQHAYHFWCGNRQHKNDNFRVDVHALKQMVESILQKDC